MSLVKKYRRFLNENFSGLNFRKPLFYNWDKALRFDLENDFDDDPDSILYFREVLKRAITLFEASFAANDSAFFVLRQYKFRKSKIRRGNFFFKQIVNFKKDNIHYYTQKSSNEPGEALIALSNIAVGELIVDQINYSNILAAIALSYQPFKKSFERFYGIDLPFEVFFINIDKKLIFHMYDNRGVDILGVDIENVMPIYTAFNNWILDYDRKRIDLVFKKTAR